MPMSSYDILEQVITSIVVCVVSILAGCFIGASIAYDWLYIIVAAVYICFLWILAVVHLENKKG